MQRAKKAVELGFADKVLYEPEQEEGEGFIFDKVTVTNTLRNKLPRAKEASPDDKGTPYDQLEKRLNLLKH